MPTAADPIFSIEHGTEVVEGGRASPKRALTPQRGGFLRGGAAPQARGAAGNAAHARGRGPDARRTSVPRSSSGECADPLAGRPLRGFPDPSPTAALLSARDQARVAAGPAGSGSAFLLGCPGKSRVLSSPTPGPSLTAPWGAAALRPPGSKSLRFCSGHRSSNTSLPFSEPRLLLCEML